MYDLSIVVCAYNLENEIQRCLDSIYNQTHSLENIQVIVIDDGSTDNTSNIIANCKYPIRVISKENSGLSAARNTGIDYCRKNTRYISFIDGDDTIRNNYIESFYEITKQQQIDIIEFNTAFVFKRFDIEKVKIFQSSFSNNENNILNDKFLKKTIERGLWFVWCRFYKVELFDGINFPDGKRYEDLIINPALYLKASVVYSSDRVLYNYFKNEGSITNNPNVKDLDDVFYASQMVNNFSINKKIKKLFETKVFFMACSLCSRLGNQYTLIEKVKIVAKKSGKNHMFCYLVIIENMTIIFLKENMKKIIRPLINLSAH